MRTKAEYQKALRELSYSADFYLDHTYYPMSDEGVEREIRLILDNTKLLQELIDNLKENEDEK